MIRKPSHAARRFVSHWFSDIPSDEPATFSLLGKYSEAILFFYVLLRFEPKDTSFAEILMRSIEYSYQVRPALLSSMSFTLKSSRGEMKEGRRNCFRKHLYTGRQQSTREPPSE